MRLAVLIALSALALAGAAAAAADASERRFIREGMGEGEVVYKIGKPDHEAFIQIGRASCRERVS
jgi:hypothetical protein